jgi:hypothetical protein
MAVVKDAQLCWGAVAMGASSFYEFWVASLNQNQKPPVFAVGVLLLLIFLLTLMAMVLAAGASAFSTELLTKPAGGLKEWCKHYTANSHSNSLNAGFSHDVTKYRSNSNTGRSPSQFPEAAVTVF